MSNPKAPRVTITGLYQQIEFPFRKITYPPEEYSLVSMRLRDIINSYIIKHSLLDEPIDTIHLTLEKEDYGWPSATTFC